MRLDKKIIFKFILPLILLSLTIFQQNKITEITSFEGEMNTALTNALFEEGRANNFICGISAKGVSTLVSDIEQQKVLNEIMKDIRYEEHAWQKAKEYVDEANKISEKIENKKKILKYSYWVSYLLLFFILFKALIPKRKK